MLFERFKKMSDINPDSPAILTEQETISYQSFLDEVGKLSDYFKENGLTQETPLAIVLRKNEVIWAAVVAASYLKVSVMLVDPNLKEAEMNQIMKMYQTCFELREKNCSVAGGYKGNVVQKLNFFDNDFLLINSGMAANCWNEYIGSTEDHSYIVLLTSGSTKVPSAVVKTVESIVGDGERIGRSLGIAPLDRVLCAAPVYHAFGLICGCFATLLSGAAVSYVGSYVLPSTLESRTRELSCTIMMALPFHYKMLIEHVEQPFEQIRFALSSTSPLPMELLQSCNELLNLKIHNIYGSSEAGAISIEHNDNVEESLSNVGQPIEDVQIKLDETDVVEVDGRSASELLINSPALAKGYLRIEGMAGVDTHSFLLEGGWWRTGDLVYLNEENKLNIVGRVNITINVNGKKVNPYEIEDILSKHPAIAEAVVVGQPDDKRGEIPVAFVVSKEQVSEQEVLQFCYQKLSNYKMPRKIEFRDTLPKTSAGKVRRKELKKI
ncbi:class I adenylate-forming enzyme family protein [Bacillus atrophaeus]|uniref:class I adenylate-forming enzyme family protein n=1 Tax=Bacillus atrophaeus TaxID=1452 RepID=UPI001C636CBE|nr:class I adenylate-forming enzyme family protein [Bacillus atrophaeus]MED4805246.1 class I adenylate-forming enzyme family protein [Bacillus atrophaeus]MED4816119.1 class I adenylate-forming enzyme family protein [Bacillus atrophaeus]MED4822944.1 class I adenylate-forming enzyme family protein [Bacillus atrophaeus]MED4842494.1 class I adenylate-forming enzyme family protein [Bacillus atrophaeus]QYG89211.1 acyl--CoA ligase [Bacillus atrophaeus]